MRVLSLFDGIACGRFALEQAGIQVDEYYASEIDKFAMQVAQKNWSDIVQLGDVTEIDFTKFAGQIDLLIGGSPCTNMSTLGNRQGLQGNQSSLFYEYLRALRDVQPKYFLLENVANMPKEALAIITDSLGVEPMLINSKLFVPQNRPRLYWTNIPFNRNIDQVDYKEILDSDRQEIQIVPFVQVRLERLKEKYGYLPEKFNPYNLAEIKEIYPCLTAQGSSQTKSSSVIICRDGKFSKLTPTEWERLQGLPDGFTDNIPTAQRYKVLGNGWTVPVIAHIFKGIKP